MKNFFAFLAGSIFTAGLVISQMTNPAKIHGFLDLAGHWDPSLLLVMAGAVGTYAPLFRLICRREKPISETCFSLPTNTQIDARLCIGSALFGIGWGLGGFCPGPAIANLSTLQTEVFLFVGAMLAGMTVYAWRFK